jgi:hypothetical protein
MQLATSPSLPQTATLHFSSLQSPYVTGLPTAKRLNSQRRKIQSLASGFSKDFSNLGLAYGFLYQNPRVHFAVHKGWRIFSSRYETYRQVWILS